MDIKKIKKAPYNPRMMNGETKRALKKSIETFDDISGITVNSRTGNIVSGNHRWAELNRKHGEKNLSLVHLTGEYHSLNSKDKFTGFLVRVVDWDLVKEQSANVTANSDLVSGEFTEQLQDVLATISEGLPEDLFDELRLEEMKIDFDYADEYLDLDENSDTIQAESEKKNREMESAKGEEAEAIKEIRSLIKISIPSELRDEVKNDLMEFLSKKKYYNDLTIV